jgi:hypothetical protein
MRTSIASDNLARNLTALGFKPLDRVVLRRPTWLSS